MEYLVTIWHSKSESLNDPKLTAQHVWIGQVALERFRLAAGRAVERKQCGKRAKTGNRPNMLHQLPTLRAGRWRDGFFFVEHKRNLWTSLSAHFDLD